MAKNQTNSLRLGGAAVLVAVIVSMTHASVKSYSHTSTALPTIQASRLPDKLGEAIADSPALYVSRASEDAGLARLVHKSAPLFCGGTKKYAAITFDDGPSATTPELLKLLKKAGIPATFFVIGRNAQQREINVKLYPKAGAIGNHTWDHPALTLLKPAGIKSELLTTNELLTRETGKQFKIMRPPYGARDAITSRVYKKLGYAEILWSADSQDALGAPWKTVAENATSGLGPGAVILMHDGPATTLTALRHKIIPAIRRSGLQMVTVPELMVLNPPSDAQIAEGPRGCGAAGKNNVTHYTESPAGER